MSSGSVEVKGAAMIGAAGWIQTRFGKDGLGRILSTMAPEAREQATGALASGWYPIEVWTQLVEGAATLSQLKDRAQLAAMFNGAGSDVAREHLSTLYKFLLSLMTPDRLFGNITRLWSTYFRGMEVTAELVAPKRGRMIVRGFGRTTYLAPIACGWFMFAYGKVGGELRISEESWDRGLSRCDPLIFQLAW